MQTGLSTMKLFKVGCCCHPAAMAMKGASWRSCEFPALVGLFRHPTRGYILFDTGYDHAFFDATKKFPEILYRWVTPVKYISEESLISQLARMGVQPQDIAYIFISHFHADHIAGLHHFNNAQYIYARHGLNSMTHKSRFHRLIKGFLSQLLPEDIEKRGYCIEDGERVKLDDDLQPFVDGWDIFGDRSFIAISLPGHAANHMGLYVQNENVFMIGDACWSSQVLNDGPLPHSAAYFVMDNRKAYKKTIDRLRSLHANNDSLMIIPSHCSSAYARLSND